MRIIAGEYKGRRLLSPPDESIRPTTDKVREAIFSMLMDRLEDAVVLDLFAGTGGMGLEALSRGAKHCYFCDNSRESLAVLRENIRICRAENQASVLACDFRKAFFRLSSKADIIFLDPPYQKGYLEDCFAGIRREDVLAEDGVIVAEYSAGDSFPEEFHGFTRFRERRYGKIMVSIYG